MSWPTIKMEELAAKVPYSLVGGPFGSKLTSRDYINDGVPVIRGSNLGKGKFLSLNEFVYVSDAKMRQDFSSNLAYPGDLVFTQRGTLGQVAIIPEESPFEKYVISQSQMKMTVDEDKASKEYLYYYFTSTEAVQRIINYTSSSGVPHINLTILRNFEVPVPPVRTQRAIASTLSAYDDLIENNRRRMQLLEQAARLLYKEWFVHLRFPGHEHVKINKGVPDGWEKLIIGEASSLLRRGITPKYDEEAKGLVINQKCIRNRLVNMSLARRQSKEVPPRKMVQYGDVLINSTGEGTLGRVAQFLSQIENCTVDSHITIARPAESIPKLYFGYRISLMEDYLTKMGRGATNQTELSKDTIADIPFILPPKSIAEYFELTVGNTSRQIQILTSQNYKLTEARDLLLPRLMNGEIAV